MTARIFISRLAAALVTGQRVDLVDTEEELGSAFIDIGNGIQVASGVQTPLETTAWLWWCRK
jgi:hypothetical protein